MVKKQADRAFQLETEWIRCFAKFYMPTEAGFSHEPNNLRVQGVSLINIRHVFRNGIVVFDDKLDGPGAIWVVEGQDQDERYLCLELYVVSEIQSVTLRNVEVVEPQVDNGDDAA